MKDNLDKGVWVNLGNVYIGTVKELVDLPRDKWEKERWRILTASGVEVTGADHQYSKLAFTSHIDKLKGIKRGKDE